MPAASDYFRRPGGPPAPRPLPTTPPRARPPGSGGGGVVLVLEDDVLFAALVARVVEEMAADLHVIHVTHLRAALAQLLSGGVDVIVTDLHVPDSHGVDIVATLRRAAPGLPIVVLSGVSDPDVARAAGDQGADDYVVKGRLSVEELLRTLRRFV